VGIEQKIGRMADSPKETWLRRVQPTTVALEELGMGNVGD